MRKADRSGAPLSVETRIEPQRGEAYPRLHQPPLGGEIALCDDGLLAFGAGELGELGRDVPLVGGKKLTTGVDQPALAPARSGPLLDHQHGEPARPGALHAHRIHPR